MTEGADFPHRLGDNSFDFKDYKPQDSPLHAFTDSLMEDCPEGNNVTALSFTDLLNEATSL